MYYFPLYNWIRKSDCSTELPDFRLEAADSLCRVLQPQLCCLPVVRRSSRTLRLVRCVQIQNSEAYRLEIEENTISIYAAGDRGFYYALATLKILLAVYNAVLPQGSIEDIPDFKNRGLLLDVSRGKMPTLDYLKQLISMLSDMKYNILQPFELDH